ncbi:MAG TPA: MFS transporter [Puia sp.]|uniref:MFS transporter n=1 Tax=Puia sp. TaxID=2045100 RepID=UPI002C8B8CF4|nr:MFS transporter [Puia sp.]HVU98599.1 MFS transporter [Puia sp.]
MNPPVYFKSWASEWEWVVRGLLLFVLLSAMTQFSLFGLVSTYLLSFLGAQPEDVSFSTNITYAALIAAIPMHIRFLRYFELRNYLLTFLLLGIGVSVFSFQVTNVNVFLVARVFTGFTVSGTAISILMLIMSRLKPQYAPIGLSVFYGAILGSGLSSGALVYLVTNNLDWRDTYLFLILFQLMSLAVVLVLLRSKAEMKRYPLYQLDWPSFILCLASFIAWAYTFIYGPKYYWLTDGRIRISLTIALCGLVALVYRQTVTKRPYLHPAVFQFRGFIIGLLLLGVYYGIKDSIQLIYAFTLQILHWDTQKLIWLSAWNVTGLITGIIVAAEMILTHKFSSRVFLLIGFSLLLLFNLWSYSIFQTDLSFWDLAGPAMLQGLGSGILFVPLMLMIVSKLPDYTGFTGAVVAAFVRFTATCNSYAGLYTLQLTYNQHFREAFLRHTSTTDPVFAGRLATTGRYFASAGYTAGQSDALAARTVFGALGVQGQLLTDMSIFRLFALVILIVIVLILVVPGVYALFSRPTRITSS